MKRMACLVVGCAMLAACTTNPDGTQTVNQAAVGGALGAVAGGILGNRLDKKGSRTGGTIASIAVKRGDAVEAEQVLATVVGTPDMRHPGEG